MKSILISDRAGKLEYVYNNETLEILKQKAGLDPTFLTSRDIRERSNEFTDTDYIFSTWGMPQFSEEEIKCFFPNLKAVFYAAGTVQYFARPYLNCGVKIFSAWAANAVPVAEYTVAQIILANKGFFKTTKMSCINDYRAMQSVFNGFIGNYGAKIGIIGAGMIGKLVIEYLKPYNLEVLVFDPFLPDEKANELGIQKVSLERIFSECNVVSNHLADNSETRGMLSGKHFSLMRKNATFLNTGRGQQIVEADLIKVLNERSDITAVLDVTSPEPPIDNSELYSLENCILTPHIAGSSGNEVQRMAEYMINEFDLYINNKPTNFEVTFKMLETMA